MSKVAPRHRGPSASHYDSRLLQPLLRDPQEESPDTSREIRVADELLLGDKVSMEKGSTLDKVDEILGQHNTPPEVYLKIVGHFTVDNDPVEVFEYDLDLSEHVSAFGQVTCNGDKALAMAELEHFVRNQNSWSSLYFTKSAPVDKPLLISLIKDYFKSQGWEDELAVIISFKNSKAMITKDSRQAFSKLPSLIRLTALPVLQMCAYNLFHGKRLTSEFSVASPEDIFEAIRPELRKMIP